MSLAAIGIDPTRVTTSPEFTVGARAAVDSTAGAGTGVKEYVYVSYVASTARAVGNVVLISPAGAAVGITAALAAAGQTAGRRVGVVSGAVDSVAVTQYGWAQIYGATSLLADQSAAAGTAMYTSTTNAGRIGTTSASNVALRGVSLNAAGSAPPALTNAVLNYPEVAA